MTQEALASGRAAVEAGNHVARRLLALSALMLFLELALIRWLGSNVLYLSFFSNLILLGSFLGIGIAFLAVDRGESWIKALPWTLLILVGVVMAFPIEIYRSSSELIFFGDPVARGLPLWIVVPVIFVLTVAVMAMVGHEVAKAFTLLAPLRAYGWDIAGSLLGIVAFSGLAFLRAPPLAWALTVALAVVVLVRSLRGPDFVALAGIVLLLGIQSFQPGLSWSPYYQVAVAESEGVYHISVNGIPHQAALPLSVLSTTIHSQPYQFLASPPERVLVIGAGSGSDVALALANGARHVDAVEIDPRMYELGRELHPDRPYDDPRVTVTIDDGRAFMERSRDPYDLIVFALPDSLTLLSGQSSLRLESYLFTTEAMERARGLLTPRGTFAMYNFYREDWLIDRLSRTMENAFDQRPCVLTVGDVSRLALLAAGPGMEGRCPVDLHEPVNTAAPTTDDYPFLYLQEKGVPGLYLATLGMIMVVSIASVRVMAGRLMNLRPYVDLFALGAAFLLVETKSVVQFALWFGTTWIVNALVFAGVLISVLVAVGIARRVRLPDPVVLYGLLFSALALAWAIPPAALLELSVPIRWLAASALTFAPIFLANLIFAQRFAETTSATAAFGANLLGAMVGGVLEYAALIVGYRALILVAAALYLAALLLRPRGRLRLIPKGSLSPGG